MSKGFLLLAQNASKYGEKLKPTYEYKEEFQGVFVDVWYKDLMHVKGQHVFYDNNVYKVLETCLSGTNFDDTKHELLVENVKLVDDKNYLLDFHRANKGDIVLDMNKLYSVQAKSDKKLYNITKLFNHVVSIWYPGNTYYEGQFVWYKEVVYKILEKTSANKFSNINATEQYKSVKLYEDSDQSLTFIDPRKNATVLYNNQICSLEPVGIENYVKQACILASSIKKYNTDEQISIITNDNIPPQYEHLFDHILQIPFGDDAAESEWKIENRWKMYQCTPYQETIVMDVDMLVLEDISHWWKYLENYDLFFTSNVKTYRNEIIVSDAYRKTFTSNNLPNIYTGLHYFKKSELSKQFYDLLEIICKNHSIFYKKFLPKDTPPVLSIDVAAAIAVKILNIEHLTINHNCSITFTHMKPLLQNWKKHGDDWQELVPAYVTKTGDLKIGNIIQHGVFHYTQNAFIETAGLENVYE